MNSTAEVVDDFDALFFWYSPDFFSDCCLQLWDGVGVVPVDSILQISPQIKIWGVEVGGMRRPLRFAFAGDESVGKLLVQPHQRDICCMKGGPILLVPLVPPLNPVYTSSTAHES